MTATLKGWSRKIFTSGFYTQHLSLGQSFTRWSVFAYNFEFVETRRCQWHPWVFFPKVTPIFYALTTETVGSIVQPWLDLFNSVFKNKKSILKMWKVDSMIPLSHGTRSCTKFNISWLSSVSDTAVLCLGSVNNTSESGHSNVKTPLSHDSVKFWWFERRIFV